MLKTRNVDLKGKTVAVSGSGNVALYTVQKLNELGAKVVTMSDSSGYIYDPDGIDDEKLEYMMELKLFYRGRIKEYADKYGCKFVAGGRPWGEKCDIAMPSATQNELNGDEAKTLVANGCIAVSEGANMPSNAGSRLLFSWKINCFMLPERLLMPEVWQLPVLKCARMHRRSVGRARKWMRS